VEQIVIDVRNVELALDCEYHFTGYASLVRDQKEVQKVILHFKKSASFLFGSHPEELDLQLLAGGTSLQFTISSRWRHVSKFWSYYFVEIVEVRDNVADMCLTGLIDDFFEDAGWTFRFDEKSYISYNTKDTNVIALHMFFDLSF